MHGESQDFRLVLVITRGLHSRIRARVELEEKSTSRSPGPFLTGGRARRLYERLQEEEQHLLTVLKLVSPGPPFNLPEWFLHERRVASALRAMERVFMETGRFGSLRAATTEQRAGFFDTLGTETVHPVGELRGGELHISGTDRLRVEIFLNYRQLTEAVPPESSKLPLPTPDGRFVCRDAVAETKLLEEIRPCVDAGKTSFGLSGGDIDLLLNLDPTRWRLRTARNRSVERISVLRTPSGVKWFAGGDKDFSPTPDLTAMMLDAYLRDRAFIDFRGRVFAVSRSSIEAHPGDVLASLTDRNDVIDAIAKLDGEFRTTAHDRDTVTADLARVGFKAVLRGYQCEGVLWLRQLRKMSIGGLLADEMGLGKTVQTLAHFALLHDRTGPFLIVCPVSVVPNWQSEIDRFLPQIKTKAVFESSNLRQDTPLTVLSYHTILRLRDVIRNIAFDTIVLDEAQMVKNEATKMARTVRSISARHRLVLTGTPLENTVTELWTHASFLNPPLKTVVSALARRIPNFPRSPHAAKFSGGFLRPILLRRTKEEVASELPAKTEEDVFCRLSDDERRLYEHVRTVFAEALSHEAPATVSSIALEGLLRLRQCCSLPAMLPRSLNARRITGSKLELALQLLWDANQSGRKVLFFAQFTAVIDAVAADLKDSGIGFVRLDGSTKDRAQPVNRFQNDPSVMVFLIAFRAGGLGLNLTSAERVLLYDPWWNPAAEEQAFARAHRIGQLNPVLIQRLICMGTVEEKMATLRDQKRLLSKSAVDPSERFSLADLRSFFSEPTASD